MSITIPFHPIQNHDAYFCNTYIVKYTARKIRKRIYRLFTFPFEGNCCFYPPRSKNLQTKNREPRVKQEEHMVNNYSDCDEKWLTNDKY